MEENFIKIYHWLYPLSWLYGIGVCLRNKLFDWGWLRSKSFDVPVICVGNLAVGGTGKTPHTEYLIKLLYLLHEAPPEEQNFPMIMEMLGSAQVKEDDEDYQSPLDILFERLEMRDPESIAVKQYAIYKQAAGKTAKSILISVGVRLAAFNLKQIANLTCTDELDLYSIGEKKGSTVLLYSGCGHQHELSGRHDLQ